MNREELSNFLTKRGFLVDKIDQGFIVYLQGQAHEAAQLYASLKEQTPVHFELSNKEIITSLYAKFEAIADDLRRKSEELDKRISDTNFELDKKIVSTENYLIQSVQSSVDAAREALDTFAEGIAEQFNNLFEMQVKEPNVLKKLWRKIHGDKQSDNPSDTR